MTAIQQVEAKDAAEHPVMHGTASTTRNYLNQNVGSAEAEKSWVRPCGNRVRKRSLRPSTLGRPSAGRQRNEMRKFREM